MLVNFKAQQIDCEVKLRQTPSLKVEQKYRMKNGKDKIKKTVQEIHYLSNRSLRKKTENIGEKFKQRVFPRTGGQVSRILGRCPLFLQVPSCYCKPTAWEKEKTLYIFQREKKNTRTRTFRLLQSNTRRKNVM